MRVLTVRSTICMWLLIVGLTACTDRNMQIEFLSKNILSSYQFEVTNAVDTDIAPVDAKIPFVIQCSKSVVGLDVYDQQSQSWKAVTVADPAAQLACVDQEKANFTLTLAQVGATAPAEAGDQRKEIKVRITVKNLTGESVQYTKSYSAFFQAPTAEITTAANLNAATISAGTYTLGGVCSESGGSVDITGPFDPMTTTISCPLGGVFTASLTLDPSLTDGSKSIELKHIPGTNPYYAYAKAQKNILVDRTAPAVSITTPAVGTTLMTKATLAAGGVYTVQGNCESGLPVEVKETTSPSTVVTQQVACVSGVYQASLTGTDGSKTLSVKQTDDAGNVATATSHTFIIDITGPGAFTISGVRNIDAEDTSINNELSYIKPQIHFTTATGAASYDVTIRNLASGTSLGSSVCAETGISGAATSADFASCVASYLSHGQQYQVYISAKDVNGNTTEATNNGYTFTVNYPTAKISSVMVVGVSAGAYVAKGANAQLDVIFDRDIHVTGTPQIVLNTMVGGKLVSYLSSYVNSKKLRFIYTPGDGEYAEPVAFLESAIKNATIKDAVTARPANLNFPTNPFAGQLFNVDTEPPAAVQSLTLGSVLPFYYKSPVISFTLPSDKNSAGLSVKIEINGLNVNATQDPFVSGTVVSGLSMNKGETYTVKAIVKDAGGNESNPSTVTFQSFQCPNNFLYIYNPNIWSQPFCIAPTEAKGSLSAVTFGFSGDPLEANYNEAGTGASGCKSLAPSAKYDLPTNTEWRAVADLIAQRGDNWVRGIASTSDSSVAGTYNYIFSGYSGSLSNIAKAIDVTKPCWPMSSTTCGPGTTPYKRSLNLPNVGTESQEIWDFSGNMYEIVKDLDTTLYGETDRLIMNLSSGPRSKYGPTKAGSALSCTDTSATGAPFCGFGSFNFICSEVDDPANCAGDPLATPFLSVVLRGGGASSMAGPVTGDPGTHLNTNAGIFAAYRILSQNASTKFNVGFRCVYHP